MQERMEATIVKNLQIDLDEENIEATATAEELFEAKATLRERCKVANIELKEDVREDGATVFKVGMKRGREQRWILASSDSSVLQLLSSPFEKYVFLSGYDAICSYADNTIEAALRVQGGMFSSAFIFRKLFGLDPNSGVALLQAAKLEINPTQVGLPNIEISYASEDFLKLVRGSSRMPMTLKITGGAINTHDHASQLLRKIADAVFFQLDLIAGIPLGIERERKRLAMNRSKKSINLATDIQYPKTEFDEAPISLYWYGRSAAGMPLLQFLAFYQVIEFYYPTYSQADARRKLKSILKDPVFRGDRDADIGRILTAIHVSRSGSFGDERSQLRATLMECIDPDSLREFFTSDSERLDFFTAKSKTNPFHKIPLSTIAADLRGDVAERIYNVRCKIVHTKSDGRDSDVELLLPFSKEADQLVYDIELVQYLAQQVLIAASSQYAPQNQPAAQGE